MLGRMALLGYQDGPIVLNLDAGNGASYSGSGNAWNDLSGNSNNGTLAGGPTYNAVNGGSFVFNGNPYVNLPYLLLSGTGNFTVSVWLKSGGGTSGTLFGNYPSGNLQIFYATNFIGMYLGNSSTYLGTSPWTTTLPQFTTNWTQVVALRRNVSDTEFYINGVLVKTGSSSTSIGSVSNFRIGTNTAGEEGYFGNISQVSVYNIALSASEIAQNFNALRGRYGI